MTRKNHGTHYPNSQLSLEPRRLLSSATCSPLASWRTKPSLLPLFSIAPPPPCSCHRGCDPKMDPFERTVPAPTPRNMHLDLMPYEACPSDREGDVKIVEETAVGAFQAKSASLSKS